MRRWIAAALVALAVMATSALPARSQGYFPGVPIIPLGYCTLSSSQLASAVGLSVCTSSAFTGTGSGTTLTASSVTGAIGLGQTVAGTGVPTGTTIVSQLTGSGGCAPVGTSTCVANGAGTYQTSLPTTSNGASLTSGGIPIATPTTPAANTALLEADTANIRFRDDNGAPTSALGIFLVGTSSNNVPNQTFYSGTLSKLQFIAATGSPVLHVAFYGAFRQ